jgi:hypothetical protein
MMSLYSTTTRQSGLSSLIRMAFFIVFVQHVRLQYSILPEGRTHWMNTTSLRLTICSGRWVMISSRSSEVRTRSSCPSRYTSPRHSCPPVATMVVPCSTSTSPAGVLSVERNAPRLPSLAITSELTRMSILWCPSTRLVRSRSSR